MQLELLNSTMTTRECLRMLFPTGTPGFLVLAFHWPHGGALTSSFFDTSDLGLQHAMDYSLERVSRADVYFRTATQAERLPARRQGGDRTTAAATFLSLDVDLHEKHSKYPPVQVARDALASLLEPSLIVGSGRGLHCYWLLDRPFILLGESARLRFKQLQLAWEDATARMIRQAGYEIDPGQGRVARLLRLPWTCNHKHQKAVLPIDGTGRRFTVEGLDNRARRLAPRRR